jgi:hypothetical protein
MYVKKVQTNLKYERELELAPCTIVSGANTAGKTGLVESISLALTGESARLGKDGKKALAATVHDRDDTKCKALIKAELSGGEEMVWRCEGTPEKATRPARFGNIKASISRGNGLEAAREGGSKLTNWLVDLASRETVERKSHADSLASMAPMHHDTWQSLWGLQADDQEIDPGKLEAVAKAIYSQKRAVSTQAKEVATLKEQGCSSLSPTELEEYAQLETIVSGGLSQKEAIDEVSLHGQMQEHLEYLEQDNVAPIRLVAGLQTFLSNLRTFMAVTRKVEMRCPCCKQTDMTLDLLNARMEELAGVLRSNKDLSEEIDRRLVYIAQLTTKISEASKQPVVSATSEQLARFNDLKLRQSTYERFASLVSQEGDFAQQLESLKACDKACKAIQEYYAAQGADVLQKLSSRVLPKGLFVEVKTIGRSLQLGLGRHGRWYPMAALSGAESAMLLAAVEASVCTDKDTPVRLLVIDDVWFDRATLIDLLKSLAPHVGEDKALTQVIVCCVEWRGKPPKGWTRLDLDALCKAEDSKADDAMREEIGDDGIDDLESEVIVGKAQETIAEGAPSVKAAVPPVMDGNGGFKPAKRNGSKSSGEKSSIPSL